jgi:hypothetical protein
MWVVVMVVCLVWRSSIALTLILPSKCWYSDTKQDRRYTSNVMLGRIHGALLQWTAINITHLCVCVRARECLRVPRVVGVFMRVCACSFDYPACNSYAPTSRARLKIVCVCLGIIHVCSKCICTSSGVGLTIRKTLSERNGVGLCYVSSVWNRADLFFGGGGGGGVTDEI